MNHVRSQQLLWWIAWRIKRLREDRGVSQEMMYMDTQIHVARIETAKVNITLSTLEVICRYFGISFSEFFQGLCEEEYLDMKPPVSRVKSRKQQ